MERCSAALSPDSVIVVNQHEKSQCHHLELVVKHIIFYLFLCDVSKCERSFFNLST